VAGVHAAANRAGALRAERGVRALLVVVLARVLDDDPCFQQAGERFEVEQLVAHRE
jgi:hypothetical protein